MKKRTLGFWGLCLLTAATSYAFERECDREWAGGDEAGSDGEHRRGFCDEDFKGSYGLRFTGNFGTPVIVVPAVPPNPVGSPNFTILPNSLVEVGSIHSNGRGRAWADARSVINGSTVLTVHYHCTYVINSNGTGTAACNRDDNVGADETINWFLGLGDNHDSIQVEWLPTPNTEFAFNNINGILEK